MPILLDYGTIQTAKKRPTFERLWELEQDLVELLQEFKPTAIAIEKPLFHSQFNVCVLCPPKNVIIKIINLKK